MTSANPIEISHIQWHEARRIISSRFPPIDLFDDVADPSDWPLIISAEQKTNPRLMETIGNLDLVPPKRWVAGQAASFLMAPFTHVSPDRPGRFHDGTYGALYIAHDFETALAETIHHHEIFMAKTAEPAGWACQFRELILSVDAPLHDLRPIATIAAGALDQSDYTQSHALATQLRATGSEGIVYPSVRNANGECCALFYPNLASRPVQARHLDYHWNGQKVDFYRIAGTGEVFALEE